MSLRSNLKSATLWFGTILKGNRKSKILYYHDVYSSKNHKALDADICMGTHLDLFKEHIRVIHEEGFKIVSRITAPENQVCIMFDDGFNGVWECREYFYENNICPTIFLPVEYIGKAENGILTEPQILELQAHGFCFECHGWSHKVLTEFNDRELERELTESKKFLGKMLSKEITGICMPLGYFSSHLLMKIKEAGYTHIYSCLPGNYYDAPLGLLTRNLCQSATPWELRMILRGGNELLKHRYLSMHQLG